MSALTNALPSATYGDLLQMSNSGAGLTSSPRTLQDGLGNASTLQLSTSQTTSTAPLALTVATGLTASGSNQGTALAITATFNQVTAGSGGVLLTSVVGMAVEVTNGLGSSLNVYPNSGAAIGALSTNAAYAMAAGTSAIFFCDSATQWYVVPGLDRTVANTFSSTQTFSNATLTGALIQSLSATVAAAGSNQGTSTALTSQANVITTGSGGVQLGASVGAVYFVSNQLGSSVNLYPPSSAAINSLSTNAAYALAAGASVIVLCDSATQYYTLGLNPTVANTITGALTLSSILSTSLSAAVSAAGASQGGATALVSQSNVITGGTGGVLLPSTVGAVTKVANETGSAVNVYPITSAAINGLSVNAAYSLPANSSAVFLCNSATQYYSLGVDINAANTWAAAQTFTLGATMSSTFTTSAARVENIRVFTTTGAVTMTASDDIIVVNKGTPAATTVNLVSSPATGRVVTIKDGAGNASSDNITLTPAAGNIDGSATLVMSTNYQSVRLVYNGTQWNQI